MLRVLLASLAWAILIAAGPVAACEGTSHDAAPPVAIEREAETLTGPAPVSRTDAASHEETVACCLSAVCVAAALGDGATVPGSVLAARALRPLDAAGGSRPTRPPLPPPRAPFTA